MKNRKPPRRASPPKTSDPLPSSNTSALTLEHAKTTFQDNMKMASHPPSAWRSMEWSQPPVGKTVLFFVMGRVMAGVRFYDPLGGDAYVAYGDFGTPGNVGLPKSAFSHWREMPSERP